jgi:hypothetical protein
LNVCEDSVVLPAVGEVVVSQDDDSGGNNIAEKTRANGEEICLVSGGRSLPEELFVVVATLDGGTAQRVVIDTTCSGDGLELLD